METKDLFKNDDEVWFEVLKPAKKKEFLKWAKSIGCKWLNGSEIIPETDANFFHYSIDKNKVLANVPISAWLSPQFKHIKRISFKN